MIIFYETFLISTVLLTNTKYYNNFCFNCYFTFFIIIILKRARYFKRNMTKWPLSLPGMGNVASREKWYHSRCVNTTQNNYQSLRISIFSFNILSIKALQDTADSYENQFDERRNTKAPSKHANWKYREQAFLCAIIAPSFFF